MPEPEAEQFEYNSLLGTVLDGKYQIESVIGIGGMATVYAAVRQQIGDKVAVKVLTPEAMRQALAVKRFQREARAVASIQHPNVISVYDFGALPDGRAYMVMEYIRGNSLRDELKAKGRFSSERAVTIMRAVCAAVHAAHEEGVIHRDLKPENVMLARHRDGSETVKVVDFGVAELHESATASALTKLTEVGLMVGTPHYMSPEQCRSESLDARSDIYSLGVIMYELLTGSVPFNSRTVSAVIIQHATETPRRLRDLCADIPWALEHLVLQTLEKDPARRPQTAAELANNLQLAVGSGGNQYATLFASPALPATREMPGPPTFSGLPPSPATLSGMAPVQGEAENRDTPQRQVRSRFTGHLRTPTGGTSDSGFVRRPTSLLRRPSSLHFDSLTGIYNTTYLTQKIDELLLKSKRLSLLVLGVDGFSQINQKHGYPTGDALLKEIAAWLRDDIGDQGIVSRLASDEFAVLLLDMSPEDVLGFTETLQKDFGEHRFLTGETASAMNLRVTVGIAQSPDDGQTPQDLIESGGRALRHAKLNHHGGIYRLGAENDGQAGLRLNFNGFVGRARELRLLNEMHDRIVRGRGKPVLVMGPTGLGKTRLVKEFRRHLAGRDILFISGHFFEAGQGAPYKTFYDSLRGPIQALLEIEDGAKAESIFGSLTDRVFQDFGNDEGFMYFCDMVQGETSGEKYLTFEYLTNLYLILAQQKPVILFFDDLHWADELSLEMLTYLIRASVGHRVFGVGTARTEGITDRHPMRNWLRSLNQFSGVEVLNLEPLSQDDTHALLRSIFTKLRISSAAVSHLYRETKGNPYFLCEIVRYLVQQGVIKRGNDAWECGPIEDITLPPSVVDVVEAALSRVSESVLDVFMQASVIGYEFNFDMLLEVTQRDERELLGAVQEGLSQHLVSEVEDHEEDVYRFFHSTVQKVLYGRLNRRRRKLLHGQVGRILETTMSATPSGVQLLGNLAYHFHHAGESQQTLKYAVAAGIQALRAWSVDEARRFFAWAEEAERRLNLVPEVAVEEGATFEKVSADQLRLLVDLNLNYGQLLTSLGLLEDAEKKLQLALALSRHMHDDLLRGRTLGALGEMCEARSEYALALLYCRQALEILRRGGDNKAEARTLCTIGMVYDRLGQLGRAAESQERSLNLARNAKDRLVESMALRELAFVLTKLGKFKRAVECAQASHDITKHFNDLLGQSISLNILGVAYLTQSNPERAEEFFKESLQIAGELNRPRGEAIEYTNLAECRRLMGDLSKALELNQRALLSARQTGSKQLEAIVLFHLGRTHQSRHEYDHALDYFRQVLALTGTISDRLLECDAQLATAEVYLAQTRPADAMEIGQTALNAVTELQALPWLWRAMFIQGRCQFFLGQTQAAERSLSGAVEIIKQLGKQLSPEVSPEQFLEDKRPVSRALESVLTALNKSSTGGA